VRKRLQELGLDLPLLPTTSVGSLPATPELLAVRGQASRGEASPGDLDAGIRQATEFWIRQQEEIGVDILVDGEMYRDDLVAFFGSHLRGFRGGGLVRSFGNRYHQKPVITGPVRWTAPITVEWWKFAQSLTKKPVKGTVAGPYTLMDRSFNEHYPNRKSATVAIAREIRKEVEELVRAGCRIIQLDEPALSARPGEMEMAMHAISIVTEKLPAYFIAHICYGEFEAIYPDMLDLPVHNIDLEMANSEMDMLDLFSRIPFTRDISVGVSDVHSGKAPAVDAVRRRLKRALAVVKPEQVWVDPDCGLRDLTVDDALGHLRVLQEVSEGLREDL